MNGLQDEIKLAALFPAQASKLRSFPEALADRRARLAKRLPPIEAAPVEEDPPPPQEEAAPARKKPLASVGRTPFEQVLVLLALLGGEALLEDLARAREKAGRKFGGVEKLRLAGLVEAAGPGRYRLTTKGRAKVALVLARRDGRRR